MIVLKFIWRDDMNSSIKIKSIEPNSLIDPYFYSLVISKPQKVKRKCLRCRKEFISSHNGNRCCGACVLKNSRESIKFHN